MPQTPEARSTNPAAPAAPAARRPWSAPMVEDLPALEELTLQSPIHGDIGGFSFLDVLDPTRRLG